jgi:hypothetical protein
MGGTWEQAKSDALAYAGDMQADNVKFPEPKVNYAKFAADISRLKKEYEAAIDTVQAKIVAMKQQCGNMKPALEMLDDQVDKSNFNIDSKATLGAPGRKITAKQVIDQVRFYLSSFTEQKLKAVQEIAKTLDETAKAVKNLETLDVDA